MLTGTSVIHVSPVAPTQTIPAVTPLAPQVAPASLIEDVGEKITPPMEFQAWMEKLKTYADAARPEKPVDAPSKPVAEAPPTPPALPAAPEAVKVTGNAAAGDTAAQALDAQRASAG